MGQYLEGLSTGGYQVFHNITGPDFNLEHVVIGPGDIFTIETKAYSKPKQGNPHISFQGQTLTIGNHPTDSNLISQAKDQANGLGNILKESTGQGYGIKPVIVFLG